MSTAVSRAAKELAVLISLEGFDKRGDFDEDKAAARIQSALANLLEKAETLHCVYGGHAPSHGCACSNCEVAKSLEPWKAEQITQKPENK